MTKHEGIYTFEDCPERYENITRNGNVVSEGCNWNMDTCILGCTYLTMFKLCPKGYQR